MKNKITLFCSNVFWALIVTLFVVNDGFAKKVSLTIAKDVKFSNGELHEQRNDALDDDIEKVIICHKVKIGNDWKFVTLSIPEAALQAHLDHGDTMGSCDDRLEKPAVPRKAFIIPPDITVECGQDTSSSLTGVAVMESGYSSPCAGFMITESDTEVNNCGNTMVITRTWTALNDCGIIDSGTQTITVIDTTKPVWTNPPTDESGECDGSDPFAGPNANPNSPFLLWLQSFSGTDSCGDAMVANNADQLTSGGTVASSLTVTFTLIDECGNFIQKDATYTAGDDTPPTWVNIPTAKTIECGETDVNNAFATWLTSFTGEDTCGDAYVTYNSTGLSDLCGDTGSETVTFTLTDVNGNSISADATFTVEDKTPPTWVNMPTDKTMECGDDNLKDNFSTWLTSFSGADTCGNAVVTHNSAGLSDLCGETGSETVTFTLTDACGNSITADATFTLEDKTPPTWVNLPTDKTMECGDDNLKDNFSTWLTSFTGEDTCGNAVVTHNSTGLSDLCGDTGSETVTFTLTDACGNSISADATFTLEDKTPPTWVNMPTDKTIECGDENSKDGFEAWLLSFSGADSCGEAVVTHNSAGLSDLCGDTGSETVTFTLTDACGNSITADATFIVQDNTPPTWVNMPLDITVDCSDDNLEDSFSTWLESFTGEDSCGEAVVTHSSLESNDLCGNTGSEKVTFALTDACGNSITAEATFIIEDKTPPTWVNMPLDKTVECGEDNLKDGFSTWLTSFTGEDSCGEAVVTHNSSGLSDLCGGTGSETVTFTLTDLCGNSITADATFIVKDTTLPTIVVPEDAVTECSEDYSSSILGAATGSDSCGEVTITESDVEVADCGNSKTVTRTWTVTDACGNSVSQDQKITIQDTTPPILSAMPIDVEVECVSEVPGMQNVTATDLCDDLPKVEFTQSELPTCGGEVTNTWTTTDACGNTVSYSQIVTVKTEFKPVFGNDPPADITVECDAIPEPVDLIVTDSCGGEVAIEMNEEIQQNDEGCSQNYTITRTWSIMDCSGKEVTHVQVITVEDTTAPTIIQSPESEITVSCSEIPDAEDIVAEDNCSSVIEIDLIEETTEADSDGYYQIIRTWIAIDECGNATEFKQIVNVEPLAIVDIEYIVTCDSEPTVDLFSLVSNGAISGGSWEDVDDSGELVNSVLNSSNLGIGSYQFVFTNNNEDCVQPYRITITIFDDCEVQDCETIDGITISKVVTANGDGINDYFEISDVRTCGYIPAVKIFNRWGHMVYESDNYQNDWGGYHNNSGMTVGTNSKLPTGTYYYIVNILNSDYKTLTGYIYLGTN